MNAYNMGVSPDFVGAFQSLAPWLAGALILVVLIGIRGYRFETR